METLKVKLTGVAPMLQHNGQLSDPLNPIAREMKVISAKRGKSDEDFRKLSDLEFQGSLYLKDGKVVIPGELLEAALINGGKKKKLGPVMKAAVFVGDDAELSYSGEQSVDKRLKDPEARLVTGVRVQQNRVQRTRPIFKDWSAEVEITFDSDQINRETLLDVVNITGQIVGLGDWRPKFGRFEVETLN